MLYNFYMNTKEVSKQFNFVVDERTVEMLKSLSVLEERSMSATIRYLIRKEYDRHMVEDKLIYSATSDTPAPIAD